VQDSVFEVALAVVFVAPVGESVVKAMGSVKLVKEMMMG